MRPNKDNPPILNNKKTNIKVFTLCHFLFHFTSVGKCCLNRNERLLVLREQGRFVPTGTGPRPQTSTWAPARDPTWISEQWTLIFAVSSKYQNGAKNPNPRRGFGGAFISHSISSGAL